MFLNPLDPMAYRTQSGMAFQAFFAGQYDKAGKLADQAIAANPDYSIPYRAKAAALAKLERLGEARATVEQLRRLVPGLSAGRYAQETRFRVEPYLSMLMEALVAAGLPEGRKSRKHTSDHID
jgi:tetratricopeptide (TPR) repeat protein